MIDLLTKLTMKVGQQMAANEENTLYDIINEMDNIMKEKFVTTFEKVREEFKKVYRELFRGGRAELFLTEPSNILETGIEIKAEPPGKKLQSISAGIHSSLKLYWYNIPHYYILVCSHKRNKHPSNDLTNAPQHRASRKCQ